MRGLIQRFGRALLITALALVANPALAASLDGTLHIPRGYAQPPVVGAPVFWEIPNALLPLAPTPLDPRRRMVVVLEGPAKTEQNRRTNVFSLTDAQFEPPVLAVAPGTKVTFENNDSVMHLIEPSPGAPGFMNPQSVAPADAITHLFDKAGTYRLRCSEVPHMRATVFVSKQRLVALPNNDGTFEFKDIPQDKYLLRVWHDGKWIHSQPVRVRGKAAIDVRIRASSKKPR